MVCRKTEIIAKEGWRYIAVFVVLFLFFTLSGCTLFALFFAFLAIFFAYIFRNPERVPDEFDEMSILAPIDGKVSYIGKVFEKEHLKKEMLKVSIDSSICDVSLQRNPFDMSIKKVLYTHGLSLDVKSDKSKTLNERVEILSECEKGEVLIVSLVGKCSRKIHTICDNFKKVRKGDRYLLLTSGRVELFLPLECRIKVAEGEKVKAGESILGYFLNDEQK